HKGRRRMNPKSCGRADSDEISVLTASTSIAENTDSDGQEKPMEWTCFEDKQKSGDWRVEAIDYENEGAVYVTIFSGPDTRERAEEYAAIKNAEEKRLFRLVS